MMRNLFCTISCMIACISTTTLVTLITIFAATTLDRTSIHKHAVTTAILDIIALAAFLVFVVFHTCSSRTSHPWRLQRIWATTPVIILPYTITMILSIFILGWMKANMASIDANGPLDHVNTLVSAAIAMWSIALVFLGIYFAFCLKQSPSLSDLDITLANSRTSLADGADFKSCGFSMHSLHSPQSTFSDSRSSTKASSSLSSVRESVQQFMQPITKSASRTSQHRESKFVEAIMPERRPSDGFETWEISPIKEKAEPEIPAAVHLRVPPRLETIPGSRPVSPAYPLNGPFCEEGEEEQQEEEEHYSSEDLLASTTSPYMSRSSSVASSTRARNLPPFAPSLSRKHSAQQLNQSEAHIHPLFRSDSPVPPPLASPGTIVTSSHYAGQIISSGLALGSRSRKGSTLESGPTSPNLEAFRSQHNVLGLSRPSSSRSIRALAAEQMNLKPKPSPSLGDLRAECAKEMQDLEPVHHRKRSF